MVEKGGKGHVAAKPIATNKDKDKNKKKPVSGSSRASIQRQRLFCDDVIISEYQHE